MVVEDSVNSTVRVVRWEECIYGMFLSIEIVVKVNTNYTV